MKEKKGYSVVDGISNEIKLSEQIKKINIQLSAAETYISTSSLLKPVYFEKEDNRHGGYIKWGEDNLFPYHLINIMASSTEHYACAQKIAEMTTNKGFVLPDGDVKNLKSFLANGVHQYQIIDVYAKCALDTLIFGCYSIEVIWAKNGENIAYIKHVPMQNLRKSTNEEIDGWLYSQNWANTRSYKPNFIPSFDPALAKKYPSQIYFQKQYVPGTDVYSLPRYYSALNYIILESEIGTFHLANIKNGARPSLIFLFKSEPEPAIQREIVRKLQEKYTGSENTGNIIALFSANPEYVPEIQTVAINDADKQYGELINIVTQKILSAWRITDPSIVGIPSKDGLSSSGDKMLMAEYRLQTTVIDQLQLWIERDINYLASFNNPEGNVYFDKYITKEDVIDIMSLVNNTPTQTVQEENEEEEQKEDNIIN